MTRSDDPRDPFYPTRGVLHWAPELFFALVFYFPAALLAIAVGLPLLPLVLLIRWRVKQDRPHRSPGSLSVAIVGGGWSGLQLAARFEELGVPWVGFEARDDFGGTWHPSQRYMGLALHTAAWLASFAGFPYTPRDERPSGESMCDYLRRFAAHHNLRDGYHFHSRVVRVSAASRTRTARLTVEGVSGARTEHCLLYTSPSPRDS